MQSLSFFWLLLRFYCYKNAYWYNRVGLKRPLCKMTPVSGDLTWMPGVEWHKSTLRYQGWVFSWPWEILEHWIFYEHSKHNKIRFRWYNFNIIRKSNIQILDLNFIAIFNFILGEFLVNLLCSRWIRSQKFWALLCFGAAKAVPQFFKKDFYLLILISSAW